MNFTKDEEKKVEAYIQKLEKEYGQWRRMRWFMLITGIGLLGFGIFAFKKFSSIYEPMASIFSLRGETYNAKSIEMFVSGQLSLLRLEFFGFLQIFLIIILGSSWITYSIINWNRHIKSALMAKAMRKGIQKDF